MAYAVKEIYYTIQGEGAHTGRPAVFCRFTGCDLWSGREEDRATAVCRFCDTDFRGTDGPGGGTFASPADLAAAAARCWPVSDQTHRYVVCTGGEPLLQLDDALVAAFHKEHFTVAVETNGTHPVPRAVDWVTVSPKAGAELVVRAGNELKLVYPQAGAGPEVFTDLHFHHRYLQPMDGPNLCENTRLALAYCLANPRWKLSVQVHKVLRIP